jgi:hypothetical protein
VRVVRSNHFDCYTYIAPAHRFRFIPSNPHHYMATHTPKWSPEQLASDAVTKKQLVEYLQQNGSAQFLVCNLPLSSSVN